MLPTIELPDGRRAVVSQQALRQWAEHVCPLRTATWQLALLASLAESIGQLTYEPPVWVLAHPDPGPLQCYLVLGDYALIIVPLKHAPYWTAVTVIPRGSLPISVRAARNQENRIRRRLRAARRRRSDARGGARRRRREQLAPSYDGGEG